MEGLLIWRKPCSDIVACVATLFMRERQYDGNTRESFIWNDLAVYSASPLKAACLEMRFDDRVVPCKDIVSSAV